MHQNGMFVPYEYFYRQYMLSVPHRPLCIVELGANIGVSARMFIKILGNIDYRITFVDVVLKREVECLIDNSRTFFIVASAEDAVNEFPGNSIDILHMDMSPHSYNQTRDVFNLYKDKVRRDGVILVHDASPLRYGSAKFLDELSFPYKVVYCEEQPPMPETAPAVVLREE
jgi:predicted O-methyltransferase YrrM